MNQYWIHIKNNDDGQKHWELTRGKFSSKDAAMRAYEARGGALNYKVLGVELHEQFEFNYELHSS